MRSRNSNIFFTLKQKRFHEKREGLQKRRNKRGEYLFWISNLEFLKINTKKNISQFPANWLNQILDLFPVNWLNQILDFFQTSEYLKLWTSKLSFSAVTASCNLSSVSYERWDSALNSLLFHHLRDHPCAKFFGRTFLGCPRREVVKRGEII